MNSRSMLIATAAAALFLTGAVTARADEKAGGDRPLCRHQCLQGAWCLRVCSQRVQGQERVQGSGHLDDERERLQESGRHRRGSPAEVSSSPRAREDS